MLVYTLAFLIGVSLGIFGGGGSILTVPILVYIVNLEPKVAIALSLGIVGMTSLFGFFANIKSRNIDFKMAFLFLISSAIGTIGGTKLAQYIPSNIQLLSFSSIMIIAAIIMLLAPNYESLENTKPSVNKINFSLQAIVIGIVTGIIGVGGGFLIVPVLVFIGKLPMKKAIGSSLLIISLNSLIGFVSHLRYTEVPMSIFVYFTTLSIVGIFVGTKLVNHIPTSILKKLFAVFLIAVGIFVLLKNL